MSFQGVSLFWRKGFFRAKVVSQTRPKRHSGKAHEMVSDVHRCGSEEESDCHSLDGGKCKAYLAESRVAEKGSAFANERTLHDRILT